MPVPALLADLASRGSAVRDEKSQRWLHVDALERGLELFDGRTGAHEAIVLLTDGDGRRWRISTPTEPTSSTWPATRGCS